MNIATMTSIVAFPNHFKSYSPLQFQTMANAQDGLPNSALSYTRYHPKAFYYSDADKNEDFCSEVRVADLPYLE